MERKKIGQIQGRKRMRRLVHNPMIQYIIINLHTKYDYSSLQSFTEIFDEKFRYSKYGKRKLDKCWEKQGIASDTIPSHCTILLTGLIAGWILISFPNVLVKGIVAFKHLKKNCDLDINHRPLKHEPIKDMFILSIGMATSLISLCFSIIGIRSRSQLLLEENFFHCSGLLIFRLTLT